MTFLMVLAVPESPLRSFSLSYTIHCQEATVAVFDGFGGFGGCGGFGRDGYSLLKLNPPFPTSRYRFERG